MEPNPNRKVTCPHTPFARFAVTLPPYQITTFGSPGYERGIKVLVVGERRLFHLLDRWSSILGCTHGSGKPQSWEQYFA